MIIKENCVFTSKKDTKPGKFVGNPASVIIFEKNENFPSPTEMSKIAIKNNKPVTAFAKQIKEKEFNIKYYTSDGKPFNFCGHGTLACAKVIKDYFNLKDNIIFYLDKNLFDKGVDTKISVKPNEDNFFSVNLNSYNLKEIDDKFLKCRIGDCFDLNCIFIKNLYFCKILGDYVAEMVSPMILRTIKINESKFGELCNDFPFRLLCLTTHSNDKNFSYEVRVFQHSLKHCEDRVGGSSSCYLANFWSEKLKKNNLKALFPFNQYNKYFGGFELIDVFGEGETFRLGGFVE